MIHYVTLIAIAYISLAIIVAFLAQPICGRLTKTTRIYLTWLAVTMLAFAGGYSLVAVAGIMIVLMALAPAAFGERAAYYIAVLPIIPSHVAVDLDFIGLDRFLSIGHAFACSVAVLLVPAVIYYLIRPAGRSQIQQGTQHSSVALTDVVVLLFVAYITIASAAELPLTSVLRFGAINIITILVPYLAVSRAVRSIADLQQVFYAFMIMAILVASIAIMSQIKYWDFYTLLARPGTLNEFVVVRHGLIRASALMQGTLVGWVAMMATLALFYFRRREGISWTRVLVILSMLFAASTFALSRGAWLAASAGLLLALAVRLSSGFPRATILACLLGGGGLIFLYVTFVSIDKLDEFGTFSYRVQLIEASLRQIGDYPLLGMYGYLKSPHLAPMMQGQGIIDIVNTYFQVALAYGLVGLTLYVGMYLIPFWTVFRALGGRRKEKGSVIPPDLYGLMIIVVVGTLSFLIMIGTTSDVAYVANFGIFWVGLSQAVARMVKDAARDARLSPLRALAPATGIRP